MKKNKAVIIDCYSRGNYHEVINQGYLMMISNLYEQVTYIADGSSCCNLRKLLDSCGYDYSNVNFVEKDFNYRRYKWAGFDYLIHLVAVSWNNFKLYKATPDGVDVFFNNNIQFAILLISKFAKKNRNRIIDMCHSELESIDSRVEGSRVNRIMGAYYRFVFQNKKIDKRMRFLLLSSSMADYFKSFVREDNLDKIGWIDHCYIRPDSRLLEFDNVDFEGVKIGIPGLISLKRGLSELKDVLKLLNNNNLKLYSISAITEHLENPHFQELNSTGGLLPFPQYNWYIKQMDALALFYTPGSYKLTASGAVLEAIWNEKPIIAFENEYFKYLFGKFGSLGVLCKSVEELAFALNNISVDDINKYKSNLAKAKECLLPKNVEHQLIKEINKLHETV